MRQYKGLLIFIQVILTVQLSVAGFERTSQPASLLGAASSGCAVFSSDRLWLNPASIAREEEVHATLYYIPSPFQLKPLSGFGTAMTASYGGVAVGTGVQSFGSPLYREITATLCTAYEFTGTWSAGLALHLFHLSIERYGSALRPAADLGFIVSLSETVTFGSLIRNISGTDFGNDDDLTQEFRTGISLRLSTAGRCSFDLKKDIRYPLTFVAGADFILYGPIALSLGYDGGTSMLSGGMNIDLFETTIHYAVSSHPILGLTHSFGVSFR